MVIDVKYPEITIDEKGYSESDTKKLFAEYGLEYKTRTERYKSLKDTIFEHVTNGRWYIARVNGRPLAAQGIAEFEGVYLLLGAKSFAKKGTRVGSRLTTEVVNRHGDKPIIGVAASPQGKKLFVDINNFKIINTKNGEVQGNEDIPTSVKSAIEMALGRGGGTPIRKIYLRLPDTWFVVLNKSKDNISKWMQILKVDIDFDSDEEADRGMMGYYAKPTPEGKEKYREMIAEIQADAKRDLGMEMPEELIQEVMGLKEPVEHIKIFHKNVYAQLKKELGREPTDKEITNRMTSTITHEAVHAAHDKADPKFMERPEEQKEFIAYMLQYPDSVIDAIEDLRTHSAIYEFTPKDMMSEFLVEELGMAPELAQLMGFGNMAVKKNIRPLLMMVDWAYDMSKRRKRDAEILVRIELVNKKANPTAWKFPNNLEDAKKRYSELYKNDPKRRKNFEAWLKTVFE